MFDRVILLAEGRTIYDGRPQEVRKYFTSQPFSLYVPPFCNLADKLISVASNPRKCFAPEDLIDPATGEETCPLLALEAHCRA